MKADTPREYRLVELRVDNFKAIKAVAIKPDRSLFKITGRNAQGKSSILDAVAAAIGGAGCFPPEPIRKGADEAVISLNFGDLQLRRRIYKRADDSVAHELYLEYADGKKPKEKQHVLDELRGSPIADDPLEFSRLKPKDRYELIKGLIDFDFKTMGDRRQELFDDRRLVGRDFEKAKGAVDSINLPADAPTTTIDITALAAEMRSATETNAMIDRRAERREQSATEIEQLLDEADSLRAQAKQKEDRAAVLRKQLEDAGPLPDKVNIDGLSAKLAQAETHNRNAVVGAERARKVKDRDELGASYDKLTVEIEAIDKAKQQAIEKAELPVKGLTFGEDDILLDGLPFEQASTARKIRVSTALLMALKPQLRVLLVREGSLLDDEARAALETDAERNDFVVLMETVGEDATGGVLIEDGRVVP
jgi:hypothetical protein